MPYATAVNKLPMVAVCDPNLPNCGKEDNLWIIASKLQPAGILELRGK